MTRFITAGVLVLTLAASALAQSTTGSLSGTITDPNGAVIPGAKLLAKHAASGQEFEALTTEAGLYVFPSLPVGPYTVTAEKVGFKKLNRSNIEIRIGQRQIADMKLEVGEVQQTVEVTAQAQLLENTSNERGQNFSNKFMETLPLFAGGIRNPESFVTYMPGVNVGAEVSINGSGGRAKEVMIDGGSLTIPESGGVVFNFPAMEMFGEFKLLTSNYNAEYGRVGGGVELFNTKSGTNAIHGRGFLNMRRDIWNANSWTNNRAGIKRPKERFNEAGFSVGGPVWIPKAYDGRNKTFWFMSLSRDLRPASIAAVTSTLPTAAMKNGDFTGFQIFDPATTSGTTRLPFANNLIPRARISRVSTAVLPFLPDPNRPTAQTNYDFVNTSHLTDTIWSLKFDHSITTNNRISYFQSLQNQNTGSVSALPGPLNQGLGESFQRPQYFRVNHDWIISPTKLLHTTVSYSRTRQGWNNPDQQGFASKMGLALPTDATPRVQFSSRDALTPWGVQDGKVNAGGQNNTTYHVNSNFTMVRGKHEFKMGGDVRRLRTWASDSAGSNGLFNFENFQTANPANQANTGHSFASFLLGAPNRVQFSTLPAPIREIRYGYHGGYFQDNWRVSSKISLQLGVRYEIPIGFHDLNGLSSFDPKTPNPGADGRAGALIFMGDGTGRTGTKRPYPTDFSNVGPRAGFAYQLFSKTVLRGGFGIHYQTLGNGGCGCNDGFGGKNAIIDPVGIQPALLWDAGVPLPPVQKPPFIDPTFDNYLTIEYMGPDFGKAPRVYSWSFNIQHEFRNYLFDIAYVGNRGRGLNSTLDGNQGDPKNLAAGALLGQLISSPQVIAAGYKKPFASFPDNRTLAQALRPYPQYLDIQDRNTGDGKTWYDSLQTKVERRFGSWQMMGAYTYSKSLGKLHYRQIFSQNFNVPAQDNYNLAVEKSFLPFDQPHVFNMLNSYDLPFGKGRKYLSSNKALDFVVGGWNIAGIQRYSTPTPFRLGATNPLGNFIFNRARRVNVTGSAIRASGNRNDLDPGNPGVRWFTPCQVAGGACVNGSAPFANPAGDFDFGTGALYFSSFRNPRTLTENLSILKTFNVFKISDNEIKVRYRADFLNMFNRTNFGVNSNFQDPNFGRATGPQLGSRLITMGVQAEF
ncbi:MAG: carboxypeptidase-like regulatory domain-containing protein [Bryobacteraceae bacterium]